MFFVKNIPPHFKIDVLAQCVFYQKRLADPSPPIHDDKLRLIGSQCFLENSFLRCLIRSNPCSIHAPARRRSGDRRYARITSINRKNPVNPEILSRKTKKSRLIRENSSNSWLNLNNYYGKIPIEI
jgi:hypothetical protein